MKNIYWRPRAVSRTALILIAVGSLVGLALVENLKIIQHRPYHDQKMAASELAAQAMERIYYARLETGVTIDVSTDPTQSGMIGVPMSPVTSISGALSAKQTSVNPNFAAVVVEMLRRAGVETGDLVAVGCSGSFPALNICVYAAMETLEAKPIVISSAAASQWGANVPELLWLDMERILHKEGIFKTRSVATSIGGYEDRGLGMTDEGHQLLAEGIQRNQIEELKANTFEESIEDRLKLIRRRAGRKPIKAYINIGGGTVSIGRSLGKKLYDPGLNLRPPRHISRVDGVAPRLGEDGVPVIHLVQVVELAQRYGLPVAPIVFPEVGEADVFSGKDYNDLLVSITLALIVISLYGFIRSDVGFRLLRVGTLKKDRGHLEPMV
ncbi:MAG TPA: poly-gamma-glutamate system protein [Pirellulales bacterium]|nr:poly-gamma-glutamate system protein [Pirellulales bacterium]